MTHLIADTSGLYAVADRKDLHHAQAAAFLKGLTLADSLLVSNHVFDETMTIVKMRLGMQAALQLGVRLRNSRLVEMVVFSPADEQETWRVFSQYADKAWSYTDCACRVLAQQRGIGQAFTFDRHFAQMGLEMAPATQP
jgi:predicted nucleic acid-binding protein